MPAIDKTPRLQQVLGGITATAGAAASAQVQGEDGVHFEAVVVCAAFAGKLPLWLAPRQVVVASIVSDADPFVHEVVAALRKAGVRAEADTRNEKINYKVREHSVGKIPVILAIGMKEVEDRTISVRRLGETKTETMTLDAIIAQLTAEALAPDLR